ncbi:hypothetical protein [Streptomyces naganishii]|uniref:PknH-like extracellular domain-containing protein n=1 Tax=Streptomyces naganishii JCM 4654 TaxID=1306179 RepID=A0A919D037_9ACTN|nr:hypothetical protein [Streptomyces naganishii]GHD95739.1 hypothetical protein GCM10010508_61650 [Streptomyces naganishii JCM 4654]
MRLPSRAARALALAALPLALAACGSSGSSGQSGDAKSSAAPSKDPNAGLLTGAQLKKALAPASFFHPGFAVDPSAARDSGDTYAPPSTAPAAKPDCAKLDGTGWIGITGVTGVSFAQNDYVNKNTSEDIGQEIDAYRGTTAADVLKAVEKTAGACHGFTDSQTHSRVKVTGRAVSGLGDGAYTLTLTDPAWENGTTLIAARSGTDVVSVLSTDGHDNGAATARKLAERLVGALHSTS